SDLIVVWFWNDHTVYQAPLAWQGLQPGVYDMRGGTGNLPQRYKLAVVRKYGLDAFLTYDISRESVGKRQLVTSLITAVLLFTLLSFALGYWLSRRVMRPVTDLAQRLRAFRSGRKLEPLAPHFAEDEVGELATPDLPGKLHTRLQRIARAVRQSTELTQALLLLSRAERSGPVDGETTDV